MGIKWSFSGNFVFKFAKYWVMLNIKRQSRMASFAWFSFFDWNIFFCFSLILFVSNLAAISLILLFDAARNHSSFSSSTSS